MEKHRQASFVEAASNATGALHLLKPTHQQEAAAVSPVAAASSFLAAALEGLLW